MRLKKHTGGGQSVFDDITKDDLIMAFFPCIYFCENNQLYFTGKHKNLSKLDNPKKIKECISRADKRHVFYVLILKFFEVCERMQIRLILENPYSTEHYLHNNFPYEPKVIDKNRQNRGDFFKKPTQYFFLNCESTNGYTKQQTPTEKTKKIVESKSGIKAGICSEDRSMISPDYARNFICDFILGKSQPNICKTLFD